MGPEASGGGRRPLDARRRARRAPRPATAARVARAVEHAHGRDPGPRQPGRRPARHEQPAVQAHRDAVHHGLRVLEPAGRRGLAERARATRRRSCPSSSATSGTTTCTSSRRSSSRPATRSTSRRAARARAPAIRRCSGPGTCGPEVPGPPGRRRRAGPGADPPRADRGADRRGRRRRDRTMAGSPAAAAGAAAGAGAAAAACARCPAARIDDPRLAARRRWLPGQLVRRAVDLRRRSLRRVRVVGLEPRAAALPATRRSRRCSCATASRARRDASRCRPGSRAAAAPASRRSRPTATSSPSRTRPRPGSRASARSCSRGTARRARPRWSRATRRAAPPGRSREPSVSATGRFVAFTSDNPAIVAARRRQRGRVPVRPADEADAWRSRSASAAA